MDVNVCITRGFVKGLHGKHTYVVPYPIPESQDRSLMHFYSLQKW